MKTHFAFYTPKKSTIFFQPHVRGSETDREPELCARVCVRVCV